MIRLKSSLTRRTLFRSPPPRVSASALGEVAPLSCYILSNTSSSQPKSQPKSAAIIKGVPRGGKASTRGRPAKAKSARPTKKTAEELDSEMADYFGGGGADAAATGAAQPAANGDANMDDEILVS